MKRLLTIILLCFLPFLIIADVASPKSYTATVLGDCVQNFKILESKNCTATYTANGDAGSLVVKDIQPHCWFVLGFDTNKSWAGGPAAAAFKVTQSNDQLFLKLLAGNRIFHIRPFTTLNSTSCTPLPGQMCTMDFRWKPFQGAATCTEFLRAYGNQAS